MAFKIIVGVLLIFCISFTLVKGSCLEYGHSCWGAHGKRSGSNKVYHADMKPATEVDFADISAVKESPYDSTEEQFKDSNDKLTQNTITAKAENDDDLAEDDKVKFSKLKNLLFKQLNKSMRHHASNDLINNEPTNSDAFNDYMSNRWRRLPMFALRRHQMQNDNWLNDLEREQRQQQQQRLASGQQMQQSRLSAMNEDYK